MNQRMDWDSRNFITGFSYGEYSNFAGELTFCVSKVETWRSKRQRHCYQIKVHKYL